MKMDKTLFAELEGLISEISEVKVTSTFWDNWLVNIMENPDVKIVGRRFIWDIFYLIDIKKRSDWSDRAALSDLHMGHIETALKQIVPKYFQLIQPYMDDWK